MIHSRSTMPFLDLVSECVYLAETKPNPSYLTAALCEHAELRKKPTEHSLFKQL